VTGLASSAEIVGNGSIIDGDRMRLDALALAGLLTTYPSLAMSALPGSRH
jgi:hypothetical protein